MGLFDLFKRSKADKNNSRETATDNSATFLKSDNNTSADQSEFNITEEILKVISGGTSYMNAEAEKKNLDDPEYGLIPEKPVYTKGISGSKIYLSSLLTDTGKEINWERAGSQEVPGINGPVDIYVGTGYSQSGKKTVYVNMYGTNNSVFSPRGFRFKHENLPEKK